MKYKKFMYISIMFLLFVSIAYSIQNLGTVYNAKPSITLDFTNEADNVFISNFNLTNSSGKVIDYFSDPAEDPEKVFKFSPKPEAERLKDGGQYTFTVRYRDDAVPPNYKVSTYMFTIQYPPLGMTIKEPRFGITSVSLFNLTINTSRNANCNYSLLSFNNLYAFDSTGAKEHRKSGINIGGTTNLYIKCFDLDYGKTYQITGQLIFDYLNPTISVFADDVTEFPLETRLRVSSNEAVICKFDNQTTVFNDMAEFDDYDEEAEGAYKTNTIQLLGEEYLADHRRNRFFVICMDKSGRPSNAAEVSFNVDTSQAETVTINYPTGALSNNALRFNATTNKNSFRCEYTNRSDKTNFVAFSTTVGKTHISYNLGTLEDGNYIYYVRCWFSNSTSVWYVDASTGFVVDSTPPVMLYVNMLEPSGINVSGKTYKVDELCAEWEAEDNDSSISLYKYYIYWDKSTDELIEDGAESPESDNEYCIDGLELNDSEAYYFEVSAQNVVGLWSDNLTSDSIEVDVSLTPEGCSSGKKDGSETDIDCGGSCSGCALGKNCNINSDCGSSYCNASNKCDSPTCDDDVMNGDETDIDCGGDDCDECSVGKNCDKDSDCKTNNCDASTGKCAAVLDTCENNKLDSDETDIDCGGRCSGCAIGKSCDIDSDCIFGAECKNGACKAKPTDADGDGVYDAEDNCPDTANEDQADVDGDGIGDGCDNDSDNDGLPDSFEQQYFDCSTCANPNDDPDKDGLTNLDENSYNTNPTKKDTDGDGYNDKEELDKGYDPLDPSSHPGGGFLKWLLITAGILLLGAGGYFGYTALVKKKPPAPPRGAKAMPLGKPFLRLPIRRPPMGRLVIRRPMMRRPIMRGPPRPMLRPTITKPQKIEEAKPSKEVKAEKPAIKKLKRIKKKDIFKRLEDIAKAQKQEEVYKHIRSLKLSDNELKERIDRLKKELNITKK